MKTSSISKKWKENIFLIACVCFFVLFVIIAAISGAWPGKDVSAQFFSAMAGALVAAIITLFLLKGQTAVEADREKDSIVFKEKLRIYQEFLSKLCDVVKDMDITPQEEIELQFQVSYVAMHTAPDAIKTISEQVKDIIIDIKNNVGGKKNMLNQLFIIADTLYKELYKESYPSNKAERDKTITNFESLLFPKDSMRLYELKKNINAEGSNQWVDDNKKLVYEYYCNNSHNKYIKDNGSISIGIFYNRKQCSFSIITKGNHPDKFYTKVQEISDDSRLFKKDTNTNFVADVGTDDSKIVEFFNLLLSKMKEYRETDLPE